MRTIRREFPGPPRPRLFPPLCVRTRDTPRAPFLKVRPGGRKEEPLTTESVLTRDPRSGLGTRRPHRQTLASVVRYYHCRYTDDRYDSYRTTIPVPSPRPPVYTRHYTLHWVTGEARLRTTPVWSRSGRSFLGLSVVLSRASAEREGPRPGSRTWTTRSGGGRLGQVGIRGVLLSKTQRVRRKYQAVRTRDMGGRVGLGGRRHFSLLVPDGSREGTVSRRSREQYEALEPSG